MMMAFAAFSLHATAIYKTPQRAKNKQKRKTNKSRISGAALGYCGIYFKISEPEAESGFCFLGRVAEEA